MKRLPKTMRPGMPQWCLDVRMHWAAKDFAGPLSDQSASTPLSGTTGDAMKSCAVCFGATRHHSAAYVAPGGAPLHKHKDKHTSKKRTKEEEHKKKKKQKQKKKEE